MKAVAEELQDLGCGPRRDDKHRCDLAAAKTIERVARVVCCKDGLDSELAENQSRGEVTAALRTADVDSERVELADVCDHFSRYDVHIGVVDARQEPEMSGSGRRRVLDDEAFER